VEKGACPLFSVSLYSTKIKVISCKKGEKTSDIYSQNLRKTHIKNIEHNSVITSEAWQSLIKITLISTMTSLKSSPIFGEKNERDFCIKTFSSYEIATLRSQ
jgi:hypothetical protein